MAITSARMQQKRGEEVNFDPDKMLPGEWAVSLDTKYVRMCFSPGLCVRMATYEAFEADMAKIQKILEECQTIEEAVTRINTEISEKANAVAEYTKQAKGYRDETKQFRDGAETSATNAKSSEDNAKVSETNAKVSETNAKISEENAQRVAETLPEDYTSLSKAFYNTAIKQKAVGDNIHVTDSADAKQVEFGLYGKATQDGEPTPDNRKEITVSGADGSVEVVSCGKNLFELRQTDVSANAINLVVNNDRFSAIGTATANSTFILYNSFDDLSKELSKGGTFTLSLNNANYDYYACNISMAYKETSSSSTKFLTPQMKGVTIPKGSLFNKLSLYVESGKTINLNNVGIQLERANESTEYQPYIATVSTIQTPDGLCGIPVESGGNYTDENDQQWIADEIVKYADGSGKRVQRIGKYTLPNDSSYTLNTNDTYGNYFSKVVASFIPNPSSGTKMLETVCTHFAKGNPYKASGEILSIWAYNYSDVRFRINDINTTDELATWLESNKVEIIYELVEPIITDLSAEEITEIEKLHTFYPITNISNDADCGMSVTYLADAKNYIDNRLALIESAMLNNI